MLESVLAQTDGRWVAVLVMDGEASVKTRESFEGLRKAHTTQVQTPSVNLLPKGRKKMMFDEQYQYPVDLELEQKIETWAEASPTAALSGSRCKAPGSAGGYLLFSADRQRRESDFWHLDIDGQPSRIN